jgi:hypothetical protein
MPRYLIERDFPEGLGVPGTEVGAKVCQRVIGRNGEHGVTWIHSYVSDDRRRSFCVYDGPSPEALRRAAMLNELPVTRITSVRVLDPYFHLAPTRLEVVQ